MNALEAQMLDRAMGRFGETLQGNRVMAERRRENDLDRAMREREGEEMRTVRREGLDLQRESNASAAEHRKVMEQIQRESKALQDRHYRLMAGTGVLKAIQDGLKDGTIKPEALRGAISDNPLFKELGLGVDIFQAPPAERDNTPEPWKHPVTGEDYTFNRRTGNFERSTKARAGRMTLKPGDMGGPPVREIQRDLTEEELAREMKAMEPQPELDEAGGPTPDEEMEMQEILSRPAVDASQPAGRIKQRVNQLQGGPAPFDLPPARMTNAPIAEVGAASAPGALPTYQNEAEARAAGKQAGDIVRLMLNGKPTRVRLK